MRRTPCLTLVVTCVACLVHATPWARAALVHDRALVDAGQAWRLATGSLVHWSAAHLLLDLLAFVPAAALVERRGRGRLAVLMAAGAVAGGVGVQLLSPGLARFAGLSGVAYAVLTACALELCAARATRGAGRLALAALGAKLWLDVARPAPLLLDGDVVAAPVAHAAGVAVALLLAAISAVAPAARAPTPAPRAPAAPARRRRGSAAGTSAAA